MVLVVNKNLYDDAGYSRHLISCTESFGSRVKASPKKSLDIQDWQQLGGVRLPIRWARPSPSDGIVELDELLKKRQLTLFHDADRMRPTKGFTSKKPTVLKA